MTLKDPRKFTLWKFSMLNIETGREFTVPIDGKPAQSLQSLTATVVAQMGEFDRISNGEYTKLAREEANKIGISFPAYVSLLIQHQICLTGIVPCYSSGIGDTIHTIFKKVDGVVDRLPAPLKSMAKAITKAITKQEKFGGCSSCGGSKSFKPKVNNLGRAGTLNRFGK